MSAFSEALDAIHKLTPDEQELILVELAKLMQFRHRGESPVHIADRDGTTVGYIFPPRPRPTEPPVLTPEEEEEDRRALQTPEDVLTTEELKMLIRSGDPAAAARS